MIKSTKLVYLLILFICVNNASQSCTKLLGSIRGNPIQLFETGHFTLKAFESERNQRNEHRYRVNYKADYKGALPSIGLSFLYIMGYKDDTGIDFRVNPRAGEKFFDAVFVISQKAMWISAHIHYIASKRPEFITGIISLSHPRLLDPVTGPEKFNITTQVKPNGVYKAFAEIVGLKSEQNSFNLNLHAFSVSLSNNTLTIPITIEKKLKPLQINITYFGYLEGSHFSIIPFPTDKYFIDAMINSQKNSQPEDYSIAGLVAFYGQNLQDLYSIADVAKKFLQKPKTLRRVLATSNNQNEFLGQRFSARPPFTVTDQEKVRQSFQHSFQVKGFGQAADTSNANFYAAIHVEQLPYGVAKLMSENICVDYMICTQYNGKLNSFNNQVQCFLCPVMKEYDALTQICECKAGLIKFGETCITKEGLCDSANNQYVSVQDNRCKYKEGFQQQMSSIGTMICVCFILPQKYPPGRWKMYRLQEIQRVGLVKEAIYLPAQLQDRRQWRLSALLTLCHLRPRPE